MTAILSGALVLIVALNIVSGIFETKKRMEALQILAKDGKITVVVDSNGRISFSDFKKKAVDALRED